MDTTTVKLERGTGGWPEPKKLLTISKNSLAKWTVFRLLNKPRFIEDIDRAYIMGPLWAIVVTKEDDVFMISPNEPLDVSSTERFEIRAKKLVPLCGKAIVEFYSHECNYFVALTKLGVLYVWGPETPGQPDEADDDDDEWDKDYNVEDDDDEAEDDEKNEHDDDTDDEDADDDEKGHEDDDGKDDDVTVDDLDEDGEVQENNSDINDFQVKGLESVRITGVACCKDFILAMSVNKNVFVSGVLSLTINEEQFDYKRKFFTLATLFDGINIAGISAGYNCFAAFSKIGEVIFWRSTAAKTGHRKRLPIPLQKVICGHSHFLALSENGDLYVWGNNSFSQLGCLGASTNTPTHMLFPEPVKDIGTHPTLNLSVCQTRSRVYIWGINHTTQPTVTYFKNILDPFKRLFHTYFSTILVDRYSPSTRTPPTRSISSAPAQLTSTAPTRSTPPAATQPIPLETQVTADLSFIVGGVPIPGHRDILIRKSPHFKSILETYQTNEGEIPEPIMIPDIEPTTFDAYKFLLYTGKLNCTKSNVKYIMDLLSLCQTYKEEELVTICETAVKDGLTVGNAMETFDLVESHNSKLEVDQQLETLEEHVLKFIVANKKELKSGIKVCMGSKETAKCNKMIRALIDF